MTSTFDGPPAASLQRLLSEDSMEFTPPARALRMAWATASARPSGSPYSIAELLAHMNFWQRRLLAMVADQQPHPVPRADAGWPEVAEAEWLDLVETHLAGYDALLRHAQDPDLLQRPIRPDHSNTVGFQITSHFAHDAHHLGQIILLRRQLGDWPPEGGGDSW